jgi:hypothetical protein
MWLTASLGICNDSSMNEYIPYSMKGFNMPLLEQSVSVKVVSDKVIVRYECEHESFAFVLSNAAAMQLSGMLEKAAKSQGEYHVGISI